MQRYRWLAISLGILVVVGLVTTLSFGFIVRAVAEAKARERGIELRIDRVRPGLGVVRLYGVDVRSKTFPEAEARLGLVEIAPTLTLGLSSVAVHGGVVSLSGSAEDLYRRARDARQPRRSGAGGGGSPGIRLDGIDVVWQGALSGEGAQHVWGARYERDADGTERLGADLVRLGVGQSQLEVQNSRIGLRLAEGRRVLHELSADRVVAVLDLDGEGLSIGKPDTLAPAAAVERALAQHRGQRWRGYFREVGALARAALVSGAKVELAGLRLQVRHDGQTLNVGPALFTVGRTDARARMALSPGAGARKSLRLGLDIPLGDGEVIVDVDGGPVSLATLGVQEGDMGLIEVDQARLEARGRAVLSSDGSSLSFSGQTRVSGLSLHHDKLARAPLRGLSVRLSGKGQTALDGSRLRLSDTELSVERLKMRLSGEIEREDGEARGKMAVEIPLSSCQDLFESIPTALVSSLEGARLAGTFAFDSKIEFDTRRPQDMQIDWNLANECHVTHVPPKIDPHRFKQLWTRTVEGPGGTAIPIQSGPGTPDWVPFYEISRHMETAVIVCEDSRFWTHDGFDHKAIQDSIRQNVAAGRFVRGASTVSMQLAKNLYLGRQKTLSRKLEEALLTLVLEQELKKEEILALYLNVIEFGPGIFGVQHAARHYFGTTARDLSLGQALYLASNLPNPKAHHFGDDGRVTERWMTYLHRLMRIAHKIHRITDDELEAGLEESLVFGEPYAPPDHSLPDGEPDSGGLDQGPLPDLPVFP